jgi:hypothetical protein
MEATQSISFFDRLWPQVCSLVIALFILFVGLLVDRSRQKKRQKKLYVSILRSIHYDYKKNLDLLCQLHAYLFVEVLPSFSMELSRSTALVQNLVPVCLNFSLLDRISHGYYELRHIQDRLDVVRKTFGSIRYDPLRRGTQALIHNDIRVIFEILLEINTEIRQKGDKSTGVEPPGDDYLTMKYGEFQNDPEVTAIAKKGNINLSTRDRFDLSTPLPKTRASGNEEPDCDS